MPADENIALVRRFVDEWLNQPDRQALSEISAPDFAFRWGSLGDGVGADELAEKENMIRAAFPDLRVKPAFTVADETFVVKRSIVMGTHRGRGSASRQPEHVHSGQRSRSTGSKAG